MVRFFINLKPKNSCYIRNYEEKCKGGCECDHSKIEVRAEQFLKCGRACAAQENTSQPTSDSDHDIIRLRQFLMRPKVSLHICIKSALYIQYYNKWCIMFRHFLNSKNLPYLSYNCSNLSTISYKGISHKTILSVPRNFLNHLRTYISTGRKSSMKKDYKNIEKKRIKTLPVTLCS